MSSKQRRRMGLLYAVIGLLLASLTANFFAIVRLRHEYFNTVAAQIWPMGSAAVLPNVSNSKPGQKTLLLLGDSRVAAWNAPAIQKWNVLNAGVPGQTSAQLALQARALLERTRPSAVVIQIGINDLKACGIHPELRPAVVDTCLSNITLVVRESRGVGAFVAVTPVWPTGKVSLARRMVWSREIPLAVTDLNRRLETHFAADPGVAVTNIFEAAFRGLSSYEQTSLYEDTLHLKPKSYEKLSAVLDEFMRGKVIGFDQKVAP